MKYTSGKDFLKDPHKTVAFIGVSGVGKTTSSQHMSDREWFHYSVDYRIWTHYLDDELNYFLKELAMKQPVLKELLMKDAITVNHRVRFNNLLSTSTYMGMLGNPKLHGITEKDFRARMNTYAPAEIAAMLDIPRFMKHSKRLYKYPHFLIDATGSICEIIELDNPNDPVLQLLEKHALVIYIQATEKHTFKLIRRAKDDPKPIYYRNDFLDEQIPSLRKRYKGRDVASLDPRDVARYLYPRLLKHRIPRYEQIASRAGYTISMTDIGNAKNGTNLLNLIARTIDKNASR